MIGEIEKILNDAQLKNVEYTQQHCEDEEFNFKINQLIKKLGNNLTREDIIYEVKNSKIAALHLAKDSKKQNIAEMYVLHKLKEINPTFIKLSSGGSSSIRFTPDGDMVGEQKGKVFKNTKSVDFSGMIKNKIWYFAQKYTTGNGGAQDNQYDDAIKFMDYGLKNPNRTYGIGLILDGDYYQDKINELKKEYNGKNDCYVISYENMTADDIKFLKGE